MKKKKSKRNKKKKQNPFYEPFPTELILNFKQISSDNVIVTDAGFDLASYEQGFKSFDWYEIVDWWECSLDEEEWEFLESELPEHKEQLSLQESCSLIDSLLLKFGWLPYKINVITAKAVKYDQADVASARSQIYWMPRQYVRLADQLKIEQATQLFF